MRRASILAIVLVLVGACSASGDDREKNQAPPFPVVALDGFAAADIRATRVLPTTGPEPLLDTRYPLHQILAAGGSLIARSTDKFGQVADLLRSSDRGMTWEPAKLPADRDHLERVTLAEAGPMVVALTKAKPESVWMTGDGIQWRGGKVPVELGGDLRRTPVRQLDGQLVVGTWGPNDERLVLTPDGGASWRLVECPAISRPSRHPKSCEPITSPGGNLWLRWYDVSVDEGRTWQYATVVQHPDLPTKPWLRGTVPLATGGWLSSVNLMLDNQTSAELLVRSGDGVTWDAVIPHSCGQGVENTSTVSTPRAIGDRWLVVYTCVANENQPWRSQLYVVDRGGTGARVLATIDRPGDWFGLPVAVGDTVVVPEVHGGLPGEGGVSLLHLKP